VPDTGSATEPDVMAALSGKLDHLIKLMDESVHLQRVALLDEGHILRFNAGLTDVALSLPNAQDDFVQRVILRTRTFYEAKLLATVQSMGLIKPEATVCDIGANIGNHSVFFGKVLGAKRVLAFEPHPHCYAALCRNLELNGLTDALAYNCMVGPTSGRGEIARFNARNLGGSAFAPAKTGAVPMVALDDLIDAEEMQGLTFIKIDVEGVGVGRSGGREKGDKGVQANPCGSSCLTATMPFRLPPSCWEALAIRPNASDRTIISSDRRPDKKRGATRPPVSIPS